MTKLIILTFAFVLGIFMAFFIFLAYTSGVPLCVLQFTDPIIVTITESK